MFLAEGGGWSLRVEQDWTCKFAEMTLKRSGNFIDLPAKHSQRDRMSAVSIFLFLSDSTLAQTASPSG